MNKEDNKKCECSFKLKFYEMKDSKANYRIIFFEDVIDYDQIHSEFRLNVLCQGISTIQVLLKNVEEETEGIKFKDSLSHSVEELTYGRNKKEKETIRNT